MPKLYEGPEPCMGCGTPGTQRARSAKNHLCKDCMTALRIGQTIVKERGLERNYYRMDDLTSGYMTWYEIRDTKIDRCLRNLLKTFSQFDRRYAGQCQTQKAMLAGSAGCGTSADEFVLPRITFEAAKELCQAIASAVHGLNKEREEYRKRLDEELAEQKNYIYNEGVVYGRNLLAQLNRGEIALSDFEATVKKY